MTYTVLRIKFTLLILAYEALLVWSLVFTLSHSSHSDSSSIHQVPHFIPALVVLQSLLPSLPILHCLIITWFVLGSPPPPCTTIIYHYPYFLIYLCVLIYTYSSSRREEAFAVLFTNTTPSPSVNV